MGTSSFLFVVTSPMIISLPSLLLSSRSVSYFTSMASVLSLFGAFMMIPLVSRRPLLSQFSHHSKTYSCLYSFGLVCYPGSIFATRSSLWDSQRKHLPHSRPHLGLFSDLWGPKGALSAAISFLSNGSISLPLGCLFSGLFYPL